MPFFGPSLAGRSNSTTGTFTWRGWAAICAPITPAPSTATFFTWNRDMGWVPGWGVGRRRGGCPAPGEWGLLDADPGLRAAERADRAPHFELLAALDGGHAQGVVAAVLGVENLAAFPHLFAVSLLGTPDDLQAQDGLALAVIRAFVADLVGLGVLGQALFQRTVQHAAADVADADFGLGLAGLVVDVAPQAFGRRLRPDGRRRRYKNNSCYRFIHRRSVPKKLEIRRSTDQARARSVSMSTLLPARAVRISVTVSGNSLAK